MDEREFELHPVKAQHNLKYHGVSFEEAATVFDDSLADIQPDIIHSLDEDRFVIVGTSAQGNLLVVVFTEREGLTRLITARTPTPRERRHYESYDPFA